MSFLSVAGRKVLSCLPHGLWNTQIVAQGNKMPLPAGQFRLCLPGMMDHSVGCQTCLLWIPLLHPNPRAWCLAGKTSGFCDLLNQLLVSQGQRPHSDPQLEPTSQPPVCGSCCCCFPFLLGGESRGDCIV